MDTREFGYLDRDTRYKDYGEFHFGKSESGTLWHEGGRARRRIEKVGQAASFHLLKEKGVVGVLDGLHAEGARGLDVLWFVVDEEDLCGWSLEAIRCSSINGGFGFGQPQPV